MLVPKLAQLSCLFRGWVCSASKPFCRPAIATVSGKNLEQRPFQPRTKRLKADSMSRSCKRRRPSFDTSLLVGGRHVKMRESDLEHREFPQILWVLVSEKIAHFVFRILGAGIPLHRQRDSNEISEDGSSPSLV